MITTSNTSATLANQLTRGVLHSSANDSDVDQSLSRLAQQCLDGNLPEPPVRRAVAGAVLACGVPESVARAKTPVGQLREDLVSWLSRTLFNKSIQETPGGLDLHKIASGASSLGWARNLGFACVKSAFRDLRVANRNVSVDPLSYSSDDSSPSAEQMSFHLHASPGAEDAFLDNEDRGTYDQDGNERTVDVLDEWHQASRSLRHYAYRRQSAEALKDLYGVPDAIQPESALDREWVEQAINDDKGIARRSLMAWHDLIVSGETPEQRAIDDRLLALWDDFTVEQAEAIMLKRPEIAYTLASVSAARLPRPSQTVVRNIIRTVRLASEGPRWNSLVRDVVHSWLAVECETFNENASNVSRTPEREQERIVEALSWPDNADRMIAWEGSPLGDTHAEVSAWIMKVFRTMSSPMVGQ